MTKVSLLSEDSPHLDTVKALWRQNSQTLGYFPTGAFDERARKRQILGAIDGEELIGYVLFYTTSSSRVRVTHLCVSEKHRGKGAAFTLVAELQKTTSWCFGIGLYCRRDFPAWNLWPKLGFQAVKEKIGRSKDGHELTFFWLSHCQKTLFTEYEEADDETVTVVMDANVFYDLLDTQRMEADESLGLTADWLQPAIRLCVTPELFNEIQRNPDADERSKRMSYARRFDSILAPLKDFENAVSSIEGICGEAITARDEADQRQLAWAIAAGYDVFVTRDRRLLSHSDAIYSCHGVTVERPAEVISRFEEIRNEHEYQRDRLIGTDLYHSRTSSDTSLLLEAFHCSDGSEKKGELARTLNRAFANPDLFSCKVVYSSDGTPLCLYLCDTNTQDTCDILLFRLVRKEFDTRLGNTVVRAVLATIIKEAAENGKVIVRIADPLLSPVVQRGVRDFQFLPVGNTWAKPALNEVIPIQSVRRRLNEIFARFGKKAAPQGEISIAHNSEIASDDVERVLELENLIWPGKISGTKVESFIVPIRHEWASDLFDGRLARNRLWTADSDLVLNQESVYYRATKPKVMSRKGRILWYISESNSVGSKMLRACSQLTNVEIGSPKDLFRKYRRLGVYEWRNVVETAKSQDGELMALEFTNTELFKTPVNWDTLQNVLGRHGKLNYSFPSPVKIEDDLFFDLYKTGSSLK